MGLRDGSQILVMRFILLHGLLLMPVYSYVHHHVFNVERANYTRLCKTKSIMTVNGQFPGPTLYAKKGDTLVVDVYNHADDNVTLHWHGVKQPRNPWSDGPEYITQCPIQPGSSFRYIVELSTEEGTVWWHAHSTWTRATVHGAIVIYPQDDTSYPFPMPHGEFIIILGEWWKMDVKNVYGYVRAGGSENVSDAYTINSQPGDFYPCSKPGTLHFSVEPGKTYLLRVINSAMVNGLFFSVARHPLTVVGSDGSYTMPFTTNDILIAPGESIDVLLTADRPPRNLYYIAASAFSYQSSTAIDNTTATAVLHYTTKNPNDIPPQLPPLFPYLPYYNSTKDFIRFTAGLRSLVSRMHPISVPKSISHRMRITVSVNQVKNKTLLAASLNNISFATPRIDVLRAYYDGIHGVYRPGFPSRPPLEFDFTVGEQPDELLVPRSGTRVKVLKYGAGVECVFQGTSLVLAEGHPMHVHGYSFYVVGWGFGNFDRKRDPLRYNLVDPPLKNTVWVPRDGWVAIRFRASNPGVWFVHCHLEQHLTWGMTTVFIVKNGAKPGDKVLPPPSYMPPC